MKEEWTTEYARAHICPTSDLFVRYLFSSPKKEHLTMSFINAVLEDAAKPIVASVEILSPFLLSRSICEKESIMDVKVKDSSGRMYDVEIQTSTPAAFWSRMTFYNNSMYNEQIGASEKYESLQPTTVIALLKDHLYEKKEKVQKGDKLHHYSLVVHEDSRNDDFYPNGDPEKFHILELDRFDFNEDALYNVDGNRKRKLGEKLYHWLRFLQDGARSDFMKEYTETELAIKEAKQEYEKFIADQELRDAQLRHEMWLHDQAQAKYEAEVIGREEGYQTGHKNGLQDGLKEGRQQGLQQGIQEGIQQGIQKGIQQEKSEIAKNMKSLGMEITAIAKVTGLSVEEINELQ